MSVTWAVSHLFSHFYCLLEKFAGSLHAGHYYGCSLLWWVFLYIHVSAKYKSHKRKVKRKKKCQDWVKLCVSGWGGGGGEVVVQKRHLCDW